MRIETKQLSELKPAKWNPRKISDKALAGLKTSIEKFGLVEPIIYNSRSGNIVGGHQRLKVLNEMGEVETDVIIVDLPENEEKALNITLNNPNITGEFTDDLQLVLEEIKIDLGDEFEELKLDDLYVEPLIEGKTDPDEVPEVPDEPIAKRGDIWILGDHRVMCGDSTNAEDVALLMEGRIAEILFTSPPYADMRDYSNNIDLSIEHLSCFISKYYPFTKFQIINLGIKRNEDEVIQYWDTYIKKAHEVGYKLLAWNVWDKTIGGSIASATAMFLLTHEWIFVFGLKSKKLNRNIPNQLDKYESRHGSNWREGIPNKSIRAKSGKMTITSSATYTHHQMHSVIQQTPELSNVRKSHPAIYPVGLPRIYIEGMTDDLDIIVDPFLGSGSTIIACEQTNRICYGMEIDENYCTVIIERWQNFTGQNAELIKM